MSRRGNCWDNAPVESFFSTLKTEQSLDRNNTKEQTQAKVFEYIEVYYNRRRRHSTIGSCAPVQYEENAA